MKFLILYPYPLEPDGQSLQGHYLAKGLKELGHDVLSCDRSEELQKKYAYEVFKPDYVIGIGFWGDVPDLVFDPLKSNCKPIPWLNADGWVANYHYFLEQLPLILTTSNWVKSTYIRDGLSGKNIKVAHIGYDPEIFYPREKNEYEIKKLRELLGIDENELMILTAGGDVTSKGVQEMFRSIKRIEGTIPSWKYVCKVWPSFSSENHGKEEKELIDELELNDENIIYLDGKYSQEFMALLLNACDIYAAPSRLEGFGMIQVEAMACGKPVISINVGGPRDTIIHKKTGFLADVEYEIKLNKEWVYEHMGFKEKFQIEFPIPKTFAYRANIDQLAVFTHDLLTNEDLRKKMGEEANNHALKNFHYLETAKRLVDHIIHHQMIYQDMVSEIEKFEHSLNQ